MSASQLIIFFSIYKNSENIFAVWTSDEEEVHKNTFFRQHTSRF